jgi:hypothetical protein
MEVIRAALAHGAASMAEMADGAGKDKGPLDLERTLLLLAAVGRVMPVSAPFKPPKTAAQPGKIKVLGDINRKLVTLGRQTMTRQNLISTQTGISIPLDSIEAVVLTRLEEGVPIAKIAEMVGEELKSRGVRINKDGTPIDDPKEAAQRMQEIVSRFLSHQLGTLIRFGIAKPA